MRLLSGSLVLMILLTRGSAAQGTGRINGAVYSSDGTPLIGAAVMVVGTSYGAMTNAGGGYSIVNLPEGVYGLRAQMVGHQTVQIDSIYVAAGTTIIVNFGGPAPGIGPVMAGDVQLPVSPVMPLISDDPFSGRLQGLIEDSVVVDLPLEHTSVEIAVAGNIQRGTVRQVFGNPNPVPIEAVYSFPLPDNGAVDRMNMYIGDRLVVGRVFEKEQARTLYDSAIEEGRTASLLEQERPNIFTQTVGNILPGDSIVIEISYVADVPYDDGEYTLSFPMVVGPRFIPGIPAGYSGTGWSYDTADVPDASRITPQVVPEGMRTGYDIDLSVHLETGFPVGQVRSVNHDVRQDRISDSMVDIELASGDEIPNRDFVLQYTTSSGSIEPAVLAASSDLGGYFMLILQPEIETDQNVMVPKEIFFVIDGSGSMSGQPIEVEKEAVRQFLAGMNPDDSFQIVRFGDTASGLSDAPLENTAANVAAGMEYVNGLSGTGGTMMIDGIRACIGYPEDPDRIRYVIFMTDGFIGNESQILEELRGTIGDNTRLFSIGIGSSPNRFLIEGLAEEGRGSANYIALNEDPVAAVQNVFEKIGSPCLINISVDWGSLDVFDVLPVQIPDLYAGQPIAMAGRYREPGDCRIQVSGTTGDGFWHESLRAEFPDGNSGNDAIATLWARMKIHELSRMLLDEGNGSAFEGELVEEITNLATRYGIVSDYTSFVAVSEEIRNVDGAPTTVQVPINMPEGVSYEGVFGPSPTALGPSVVGVTCVVVQDQRAMIERDVTASVTVLDRDEERTLPVITTPSDSAAIGLPVASAIMDVVPDGFDTIAVLDEMKALGDSITLCYREYLDANPEAEAAPEGTISFWILFSSSGEVESVNLIFDATGCQDLQDAARNALEALAIARQGSGRARGRILLEFHLPSRQ